MTRWVLNSFPTWAIGTVMVIAFVGLTLLGQRIVRRRVAGVSEGDFNELTGRLLETLLVVFGFVLAFTIVFLYQALNDAKTNVEEEATLLSLIYRDSRVFDDDVQADMDVALEGYVHEVVEEEWPLMAEGRQNEHGMELIDGLFNVFESWEPRTVAQQTFYADAVSKLNDVAAARRARLEDANEELPAEFELLIFSGALALMVYLWMFGTPHVVAQTWMIGLIAFLVALNLLLVVILDHPFAGDFAVSSHPFKEGDLRVFWP